LPYYRLRIRIRKAISVRQNSDRAWHRPPHIFWTHALLENLAISTSSSSVRRRKVWRLDEGNGLMRIGSAGRCLRFGWLLSPCGHLWLWLKAPSGGERR
jgi:hypothetical protein